MLPKGIIITNSNGDTYTTGNRGKPPKWLHSHPDYLKLLEATPVAKAIMQVTDNALKFWKWADQLGEEGNKCKTSICIVAANDANHAMQILARRFPTNPVYPSEFNLMWKQIDADGSILTPGVYEPNADKLLTLKVA
jgi:hypothetical protein